MATRNETHVHDLSTLANFKDWAQSINTALTAFGWTQSSDTGQVNWSTIVSVPASGASVYEIWTPGDGGTAFYVRIDYWNNSSQPQLRIAAGTTTNGSGTLTGSTTGTFATASTANSGATLYNCLFSGDSGSFGIMMWRDLAANGNCFIGVDRSRNSSGSTTNTYFTVFCLADTNNNSNWTQRSVLFSGGAATTCSASAWVSIQGSAVINFGNQSQTFNGTTAISPVFPMIGYFDVPTLAMIMVAQTDYTEASVITTTILGASHSFLLSKNQRFNGSNNLAMAMRWE